MKVTDGDLIKLLLGGVCVRESASMNVFEREIERIGMSDSESEKEYEWFLSYEYTSERVYL